VSGGEPRVAAKNSPHDKHRRKRDPDKKINSSVLIVLSSVFIVRLVFGFPAR
jgi:hypothetical protein